MPKLLLCIMSISLKIIHKKLLPHLWTNELNSEPLYSRHKIQVYMSSGHTMVMVFIFMFPREVTLFASIYLYCKSPT